VTEAYPERKESRIETGREPVEAKIKICLVEVEGANLEANPEGKEIVAEQRVVPKEEATVKTVRALKKWYGDQHLAVGCQQQLQKWT
jgi:hypothetical protein